MRPLLYLAAVLLVLACLASDSKAQCTGPGCRSVAIQNTRLFQRTVSVDDGATFTVERSVVRSLVAPVRSAVAAQPVRRLVAWRPLRRVADRIQVRRTARLYR